jgi:hypothetical protein
MRRVDNEGEGFQVENGRSGFGELISSGSFDSLCSLRMTDFKAVVG